MYLKRLEMLGFKSFATRTTLEFSTGITAVIGPNGAGKSNVADAMRWVLGEQSMRQLRGKRSDDIIFIGGHGKAALGMAEVSLTLDNSTGWVPSEYSEITVARRSYRSGENEYLINKQRVRLKDVILLLAQARIGHDSYTVVGQGLIDAALSLRAEERRGLFEDAAGIRPFQVQRSDADGRLRQTEQNLDRLRDIIGEIEPRLAPLQEQARRAVEFKQLNSELQDVLLTWYALQWRRLCVARERAEAAEQEQAQKVQQLEQSIQASDERGDTLRVQRQSSHTRIAEARQACGEANELVKKAERELAVGEERINSLGRQRVEQQQEERRLRERSIAVQQQIIDQEEQCDLADEAVDTSAAALASFEVQVARIQKDYEMDERRLRGAQNDLIQVQARLGASQSDLGRQQKHLGERNQTLATRRETIAHAQQLLRSIEGRLVEERAHLDTARQEEQKVTQRKHALARAVADAQQEIERLKSTLAEAERQRRTIADRLNLLNNWRQNLTGYSDGVRGLLRTPPGKLTGILGPIPQLGVALAGMETALEAALGPYLQAVVVQTQEQARACLRYLHEAKLGKAMVLWIEDGLIDSGVNEEQLHTEEEALHRYLTVPLRDRVLGSAWRYVQCEQRFLPLFHKILRGIVLVKDIDTAWELLAGVTLFSETKSSKPPPFTIAETQSSCESSVAVVDKGSPFTTAGRQSSCESSVVVVDKGPLFTTAETQSSCESSVAVVDKLPFEMLVTLKGETLHSAGWLAGGSSKDGSQQGLLAYERELREVPQQLDEQIAFINRLNGMISEAQRDQEGRRVEQVGVDKELQKIVNRINELNKGMMTTQRDQERLQTELRLAVSVEQQLAAEVVGLEQEVQAAQERVRAHEKSQREMAGLVEELQRDIEERAIAYRRQQEELGHARTALAVKRQEAKSLHQQLATQQMLAQEVKTQLEQQLARVKEAEQRLRVLQETMLLQRNGLAVDQEQAEKLATDLRSCEEQASEIEQQLVMLEHHVTQLRHTMTELEGVYRRCLLESQRARDAIDILVQQLQEEMGLSDPKELSIYTARESTHPETDNTSGNSPSSEISDEISEDLEAQSAELSEEEEAQLRKLRRRVEGLRSRIRALGGSDPDAPQQYEELRTRFEFLSTQIGDMEQAALHLHSIIAQLDTTMARQFEATFQAVNVRFREHFITLFNGGNARLELTAAKANDDDVPPSVSSNMPAGVDVIVQPPGKKVQDLSVLSGGERALVSAALLFALLEINPPPFCLLDEVDAALDESNVTRFCDILKRLAQRTQFIMITHNRVTMMSAQVIYGVTMGVDSVSRLLSMKLEETPVAGDR